MLVIIFLNKLQRVNGTQFPSEIVLKTGVCYNL